MGYKSRLTEDREGIMRATRETDWRARSIGISYYKLYDLSHPVRIPGVDFIGSRRSIDLGDVIEEGFN